VEPYKIEWKSSAKKDLKRLPKQAIETILTAVDHLPDNSYPVGSKKIMGTEHTYRLRIGNYRIVYSIENNRLIIEIIRIGHRKDVYRNIT